MKIRSYFRDINNTVPFILLIIICAIGFVLRFPNLGYLSFWGDDGHTVIGTASILKYGYPRLPSGNILWQGIFDYYLKALPALAFGIKEFSFRIVSLLSGMGTIIAAYFIGKEIGNKFIGLLSASVISFSTWYIQFSREARYYADYQFFFTLSFLFFYLGFIKEKKPFRIIATIFMVLTPLVHGVGVLLLLLFPALVFYKGRNSFRKENIIPFTTVFLFNALIIVNQVFFWKVGRSFYAEGSGFRSLVAAYLKFPDPFYFKVLSQIFPKMFYVFLAGGCAAFIFLSIYYSLNKNHGIVSGSTSNLLPSEKIITWGRFMWPYNLFLLLFTFFMSVIFISLGQMYGQQRYVYFLMPIFVTGFAYVVYLVSIAVVEGVKRIHKKIRHRTMFIVLCVVFGAASVLLVNGIDFREGPSIAYKKHNDSLDTTYSISSSWGTHWDAASGGRYVADHLRDGDIVITTDIYNSPPYSGKVDYWLWTGNLISWAPYHEEGGKVIDDTYGVEVLRDIISFAAALNENPGKNIWLLTSKSLYTKEHVDPGILKLLDGMEQYRVLTGRDDISRLYFFPSVEDGITRVPLETIFDLKGENILKLDGSSKLFDFTNPEAQKYLVYGYSQVEPGVGTWNEGKTSLMFFNSDADSGYEIMMTAKPLDNKKERQAVTVVLNNHIIGEFDFLQAGEFEKFVFSVDSDKINKGNNSLAFRYRYITKPEELGIGNDTRELSVLFQSLEINPK